MLVKKMEQFFGGIFIKMRDQRAAPNQVEILLKLNAGKGLSGEHGSNVKVFFTKMQGIGNDLDSCDSCLRESNLQEPEDSSVATGEIQNGSNAIFFAGPAESTIYAAHSRQTHREVMPPA
jgi:hypothetical protein